MKDGNLFWIENIGDGDIRISTKDGEIFYKHVVKVLNLFDKICDNEPKNDFLEMVFYWLVTHGVNKILLGLFCGIVLNGPALD